MLLRHAIELLRLYKDGKLTAEEANQKIREFVSQTKEQPKVPKKDERDAL